ncbi:MAG TPA: HAMP domain-containing sensor histidine kinase [Fervidobacterium sp.]|nr:sensor histidine kinase [Fervidobacterium sp.]HOK87564.1 HAMP domain-containing sensor histidine kinase [Fervidobacterium sp.]HOM73873.1 HAMP domain-containing sensor histidine kinase [Fervidobacterium sp.]HPP17534.1 HAMP domain-containing sensor histidine kinase [Fervidobacterium sp.]HPZ17498.1 HAMP domain-containing sensor histidine kinase [Fervidobacterium sp.]
MKRLKIRNKYVLYNILTLIVMIVGYVIFSVNYISSWRTSLFQVMDSFAQSLSYPTWTLNSELVSSIITPMVKVGDVLSIRVMDDCGNELAYVGDNKNKGSALDRVLNIKRETRIVEMYYEELFAGRVEFHYYYWTPSALLFQIAIILVFLYISVYLFLTNLQKRDMLEETARELNEANSELELAMNELEETQQRVINSEKMAALGKLMVNIAHDVNTPTGIIYSSATELLDKYNSIKKKYEDDELAEEEFQEYIEVTGQVLDIIIRNSQKIRELVQSLKRVAMQEVTQTFSNIDFKELLDDVLRTLHPKLRKTQAEVVVDVPENLVISTVPGAWAQILMNLIDNSIVHGFEYDNPGKIEIIARQDADDFVLEYIDNGKGMDEETKRKLFEPFFTTDTEHSSGLGLSIVYQLVVELLGGEILLESQKEKGVRFTIRVPMKKEEQVK